MASRRGEIRSRQISALELCSVCACKDYNNKNVLSTKVYLNKLREIKMISKECYYCGSVCALVQLKTECAHFMMKGQSNEFNPNTGSQEPYGDSSNKEQVSGG